MSEGICVALSARGCWECAGCGGGRSNLIYNTLPSATRMASPLTPLDSSEAKKAIISATS
jgi:hypothetical protein